MSAETQHSHTIVYEDGGGVRVRVVVPWGYGTGRIPPPLITFVASGQTRTHDHVFIYQGKEEGCA